RVNYEAQAAIELEAIADASEAGYYPIPVTSQFADMNNADSHAPLLFQAILSDIRANVSPAVISARFHNGLAQMVVDTCSAMRAEFDLNTVALSGGVWQNMTLLTKTLTLLDEEGFEILIHSQVPANDGGLSLGQAVIAAHQLK
ncbi:MAG: carbamoyltransferase HypF, partial [Chloroflexota bacterium]|nr:carbamoyltransferase HypF [Chloroflexota bacterium]